MSEDLHWIQAFLDDAHIQLDPQPPAPEITQAQLNQESAELLHTTEHKKQLAKEASALLASLEKLVEDLSQDKIVQNELNEQLEKEQALTQELYYYVKQLQAQHINSFSHQQDLKSEFHAAQDKRSALIWQCKLVREQLQRLHSEEPPSVRPARKHTATTNYLIAITGVCVLLAIACLTANL